MLATMHYSRRATAALSRGEPGYDPDSLDVDPPAPSAQLAANAHQLHRYLTCETDCRCGAVVRVGERRCSKCGACSECGYFGCRAGAVSCDYAIGLRWERYVERVAPLVRVATAVFAYTAQVSEPTRRAVA